MLFWNSFNYSTITRNVYYLFVPSFYYFHRLQFMFLIFLFLEARNMCAIYEYSIS